MERLQAEAAALEEYAEYRRIVGDDDGGKLFTPEEYEEYKRKVLPIRLQNRLYVSWRSPTGTDCKLVGPETLCFCTHRYKQHKTDYEVIPKDRPICVPCRVSRCQCQSYHYVPLNGTQPIRCRCKHFADQHSAAPGFSCNSCSKCLGFHSCFTCACGQPTYAHETVVETKQERLAQGKPVGQDVPYAAMGGLTGFSSLAEGYMRLDDSGIGTPPAELAESLVTSVDHPFLKAFEGPSSSAQTISQIAGGSSATRQASHGKHSEDDDMAYFEKRYQERASYYIYCLIQICFHKRMSKKDKCMI
uniref:Protein FAM221A n=1 Tax=Accipiter nisus TaxID=211598 RepID=A0A8B9NGZ2_9AVES